MKALNIVLNVVWLVIWGLWMAIGYALLGLLMFIFIITIPWGIASLRIANYVLWPFGRTTVERRDAGVGSLLGNIIWLIFAGIWLAIGHVVAGIGFCLTIIGIPFGIANFKMVPISLVPLGREIVPVDAPLATR
ncbi:YccF domain-containing protein [Streptomyces sp. ME03-5709C]|nr:YccF domain-containing protein [Streptomyces sp. ME03-5709C]